MPFTTEYNNMVNPLSVVEDAASENLVPMSVWLPLLLRTSMPTESKQKEIRKRGSLARSVLPENTQYTYGVGSEYSETSTLIAPYKSVVISRVTKENEKFGQQDPLSVIGEEQGKALRVGAEEDVATMAAGFTSAVTAGAPATQADLLAAAFNVDVATSGHAAIDAGIVAVLHPKTFHEAGVIDVLSNSSATIYGNSTTSLTQGAEGVGRKASNGYKGTMGGIDIFTTNIVADDGTYFHNLVFDRSRALIACYDDSPELLSQLDIEYFRQRLAMCWFMDVAIHWDEAGCRLDGLIA